MQREVLAAAIRKMADMCSGEYPFVSATLAWLAAAVLIERDQGLAELIEPWIIEEFKMITLDIEEWRAKREHS